MVDGETRVIYLPEKINSILYRICYYIRLKDIFHVNRNAGPNDQRSTINIAFPTSTNGQSPPYPTLFQSLRTHISCRSTSYSQEDTPSTVMGLLRVLVQLCLLALLSIYVFFGLVYLITGIRVKRVGYLSIRWIQWISRSEGITVEIRKIGLRPQRPTVARRTWLGVVVSDATITYRPGVAEWESDEEDSRPTSKHGRKSVDDIVRTFGRTMAKSVQYRLLNWVDLELSSTTIVVEGAGTFQVGMFLIAMNSKPQMFKRERILSPADTEELWSSTPQKGDPLEFSITIRDLYFSLNDKEFTEIAKTVVVTVDFLLGGEYGMREVKAALRIAGFSIPFDNWSMFARRIAEMRGRPDTARPQSPVTDLSPDVQFIDIFEELQVFDLRSVADLDSHYSLANFEKRSGRTPGGSPYSSYPRT
jgi:Mitochondrial protein from FMP27